MSKIKIELGTKYTRIVPPFERMTTKQQITYLQNQISELTSSYDSLYNEYTATLDSFDSQLSTIESNVDLAYTYFNATIDELNQNWSDIYYDSTFTLSSTLASVIKIDEEYEMNVYNSIDAAEPTKTITVKELYKINSGIINDIDDSSDDSSDDDPISFNGYILYEVKNAEDTSMIGNKFAVDINIMNDNTIHPTYNYELTDGLFVVTPIENQFVNIVDDSSDDTDDLNNDDTNTSAQPGDLAGH